MSDLLLPTTVVGSHAYPGWFFTALEEIEQGRHGSTDAREAVDDAVNAAILDQGAPAWTSSRTAKCAVGTSCRASTAAWRALSACRNCARRGVCGYDMPPRYRPVAPVTVPRGLGIVEEARHARQVALPRWLTVLELQRMVEATQWVRQELTGARLTAGDFTASARTAAGSS